MPHPSHSHQHGHAHDSGDHDWDALVAQIEREGEILLAFVTDAARWVSDLRGNEAPVRRVLDIGGGPGVGSCELARRFADAQVVAVDGSQAMLDRTTRRAEREGIAARVHTRLADLPHGLDGLGPADVIWASMSLHHVGDEIALLRALRDLLGPGGMLAIAERADPTRFLPDDLDVGDPGLADRLERAEAEWFAGMRANLPGSVPSRDLESMFSAAGLAVVGARRAELRFDPPLSGAERTFVSERLARAAERLDGLRDNDVRALRVLSDPDDPRGVTHRDDVFIAASREIVVGRPKSNA
jgi:SAM-dependent methyltransferase